MEKSCCTFAESGGEDNTGLIDELACGLPGTTTSLEDCNSMLEYD